MNNLICRRCTITVGDGRGMDGDQVKKKPEKPQKPKDKEWEKLFDI
jgi:hypothetical protein